MNALTTVTIAQGTPDAPIHELTITGEVITPGLAVTPAIDHDNTFKGGWSITHLPSGWRIIGVDSCLACIRAAIEHLTDSGVDWTRDKDTVIADEWAAIAAKRFAQEVSETCSGAVCPLPLPEEEW